MGWEVLPTPPVFNPEVGGSGIGHNIHNAQLRIILLYYIVWGLKFFLPLHTTTNEAAPDIYFLPNPS